MCKDAAVGGGESVLGQSVVPGQVRGGVVAAVDVVLLNHDALVVAGVDAGHSRGLNNGGLDDGSLDGSLDDRGRGLGRGLLGHNDGSDNRSRSLAGGGRHSRGNDDGSGGLNGGLDNGGGLGARGLDEDLGSGDAGGGSGLASGDGDRLKSTLR